MYCTRGAESAIIDLRCYKGKQYAWNTVGIRDSNMPNKHNNKRNIIYVFIPY